MSVEPRVSWFQKNPKKTLFGIVLVTYLLADLLAGSFLLIDTARRYHPEFHHGFVGNQRSRAQWGQQSYIIKTNSLGFKDADARHIALTSNTNRRIVVIGDSFTEGVGYPYEKTFVGITEHAVAHDNIEIFNAGVMSYSPKLYHAKIRYLLEDVGFRFDELYVYLDISDVQDEIVYRSFTPGTQPMSYTMARAIDGFVKNRAFTYRVFRDYMLFGKGRKLFTAWCTRAKHIGKAISLLKPFPRRATTTASPPPEEAPPQGPDGFIDMQQFHETFNRDRARWTDEAVFQAWGKQGLLLAEEHMQQLYALCGQHGIKMAIAVYPWKYQIENHDLTSRHVTFWQDFAAYRQIEFLNYFPDFINTTDPCEVIATYFIDGDLHWNAKGHKLMAKKLIQSLEEREE